VVGGGGVWFGGGWPLGGLAAGGGAVGKGSASGWPDGQVCDLAGKPIRGIGLQGNRFTGESVYRGIGLQGVGLQGVGLSWAHLRNFGELGTMGILGCGVTHSFREFRGGQSVIPVRVTRWLEKLG